MRIIEPKITVTFHQPIDPNTGAPIAPEQFLERAGRICYKSEDRITATSASAFVAMIENRGHLSVLEHCTASAHLVCDRGVTHELVRHRIASFSQESTRYCNYTKSKHNRTIGAIEPPFVFSDNADQAHRHAVEDEWREAMVDAEKHYFELIELGQPPQIARSVLPIGLKTEIVMTANLREWMHVFTLRCSKKAHPQIRHLMLKALDDFAETIPSIFAKIRSAMVNESKDST